MSDLYRKPDGPDGLRIRRIRFADTRRARAGVRGHGLQQGRGAPLQGRGAVPPGRHQLHRQQRAAQRGGLLRRRTRPVGLRHGVSGPQCAPGLCARARTRRAADRDPDRPDGTAPAGDQGHRRRAAVPDRPLRGRQVDLRHRLRMDRRRRPPSARRRPEADRPPDAQRLPRPHGVLGRLLREAVQLPRDPLLRHQGRIHRPDQQGDDRARRQDPHPAERGIVEGRRARSRST